MKRIILLILSCFLIALNISAQLKSTTNAIEMGLYDGCRLFMVSNKTNVTLTYQKGFTNVYVNNSGVINNGFVIYSCTLDTNGERFKGLNSYNRISTHTTGVQGLRNEEIYLYIRDERLIRCSNTSTTISLNTNNPIKWERSSNDGQSWDNLICTNFYYEETNPQIGKFLYRALNGDGTYSEIVRVTYVDAIPETINTLPSTSTKTVDETIIFTLELTDDDYNYQWYKDNVAIEGATYNTYSIDAIKVIDEGSYYCRVWNDCNSIDSKASILTVNKAPQIITFEEIPVKIYGDANFTLPEKTDKGLTIVYQSTNTDVATISGNTVTIKNPGVTTIVASQAGNQDYLSATIVSRTLTVNKQSQSFTFNPIPAKQYGDPTIILPEKTDKNLAINYQSTNTQVATISGNILTIVGAGTCDIIASQAGDTYHYAATPITQPLTVTQASQAITFPNFAVKTYGDADITLNQYSDAGLEITYTSDNENVAKINGNIVVLKNAGSAQITANQSGDKNYLEAPNITRTLTINKANQTIVWDNIEPKTYGDEDFYLPEKTDKGLAISYISNDETIAIVTGNKVEIKKAGNTTITATQAGNSNYHPTSSITLPINVSKALQEIKFNSLENKTYGDANFNLNATNNSGITITYESSNTNVATINGNVITIVGAGETYITALSVGNENYFAANPKQQLLTVNKAPQTISLDIIPDKTYGDETFTLNAQNSALLPIIYKSSDPSKLYISGNQAAILGAGTFTVTAEQTGTTNYLPISTNRTFTVKKAQLIISADNKEKIYGDENPTFTYSFEGFKNGDSKIDLQTLPSILCTANKESSVGEYDITVTNADDNNYSFLYRGGKLDIRKALLTVKPNDETRKYGDKNPVFTVVYSGFKNDENTNTLTEIPIAITNAKATSNTGKYDIIVSGGAAVNYDFNYQNGGLIIEKSTLTIVAEDKTKEAGEENPTFSLVFYDFKNGEDVSVLDGLPTITCEANENSLTGFYDIILSGGIDNNYSYNLINGKLEITAPSGINNNQANLVTIYPNPAKDYVNIKSEQPIKLVELYNQTGKLVLLESNFDGKIDVSILPSGVYIIKVHIENEIITKKIIIQ